MNGFLYALSVISGLVSIVVLLLLTGWAARRLLGVQVGTLRSLLAAVTGLMVAGPLATVFFADLRQPDVEEPWRYIGFWPLVIGTSLLMAVFVLAVLETFVPTGSWPGVVGLVRSVRSRFSRGRRYSQIVRIAVRHGLGPYLGGRRTGTGESGGQLARSLRLALDDGGVTFVKLGQLLSTRRDLLPDEFVEELRLLQDQVAPVSPEQIEEVLTAELGMPAAEAFAEFEVAPVAAASVAQVHRARLRSGELVAVKIQRPGVRRVVERDLDIIRRLAQMLEARTKWGRAIGVRSLADGFTAAVREELDFRVEARNLSAVRAASAERGDGPRGVEIPAIHGDLSTRHILVQEWMDGTPIGAALPAIHDRALDRVELSRTLLESMLRQVMLDGIFHADPHPGNIMLLSDSRLALLDFGSVGRIDTMLRQALQHMLLAIEYGDPAGLRDALLEVVSRPEEIDESRLERALGQFMARHLHRGARPDVEMFTDLFRIVSSYGLAVPSEIAAVFRALATLEGTLTTLEPAFDIVAEAREFASRQLSEQLGPTSVRDEATKEVLALLPVLRRLPRRIDRLGSALENGRLGLNVRLFADERDRVVITDLVNQGLLAFVGAATAIVAVLLLGTDGGPGVTEDVTLFEIFGYNLLMVSALLLIRVLVRAIQPFRSGDR